MKKRFNLKPEKEKELLRAAKPVVTIFSAISSLKKEISEKERKMKNRRTVPGEIAKLKTELKKKEQELEKMDQEKITKGWKAVRFLIDYNRHLVEYIAKGYYYYFGGGKISHEELISEGISSLPKAIEKFDLNSKNQFCTYANFWIRQYFQSYIKKIQFINQSPGEEEKKTVVYYESNYQNEDKESKSYSLLETLHDEENAELTAEETRHQETVIQTNNLINALKNREAIMLVRLLYKIKPISLLDIYYMATTEEKKELRKEIKMSDKSNPELLQKYSCQEKKISNLPLVIKYLAYFTKKYKLSEVGKKINKSESVARQLKQESFKKLQKLAQERKLHFLIT